MKNIYIPIYKSVLQNISSIENVSEDFQKILDIIVKKIVNLLPEKEGIIYLRGSLAYGNFIEQISDLDLVVFLREKNERVYSKINELVEQLNEEYNDLFSLIDVSCYENEVLYMEDNNRLLMNIALTGIVLYEKNNKLDVPLLKFDKSLQNKIIRQTINDCHTTLKKIKNRQSVEYMGKVREANFLCVWYFRDYCRGLIALCMHKKRVFSLNVNTCCNIFSQVYPEYSNFVEKVRLLEKTPINNWDELYNICKNSLELYLEISKKESLI